MRVLSLHKHDPPPSETKRRKRFHPSSRELRSKIDAVWNAFWAGGYRQSARDHRANHPGLHPRPRRRPHARGKQGQPPQPPHKRRIFPTCKDGIGRAGFIAYEDMRWSRLKHKDPATMFTIVAVQIFPFAAHPSGKESSSFLKKRTKKLLQFITTRKQSVIASRPLAAWRSRVTQKMPRSPSRSAIGH